MERKKLPNDLSLDALIEAAINESEELTSDADILASDVTAFLSHYKISSGNNPIATQALYKLYKIWSKKKINQAAFTANLSLYIKKENRYYLINKDPSELIADLVSVVKKTKPPPTRKKSNWDHFKAFMSACDVHSGNEWVEAHIIHHFYDKWVFNTKRKKVLNLAGFYSFLKLVFETRQTKEDLMVKITNTFEQSSIQNLREAWKRKQKGRK